jgi:hypothetical protein
MRSQLSQRLLRGPLLSGNRAAWVGYGQLLDIIDRVGRLRRGDLGDDWLDGPVQYVLPPSLVVPYAREPAVIAYVKRAARLDPARGLLRNPTWRPWEGIFEYLACVEYAWHCLQPRDDRHEGRVLYHARALVFFAQATLDLTAVWLQKHLSLDVKAQSANCAFHKTKFQEELVGKSEDFDRLLNEHRDFIEELTAYRMEWIHRVPGRPVMTIEENERAYRVPIDPSMTIFDEGWQAKREDAVKRYGHSSFGISDFANRFAWGTKKLVLATLMASLRHPSIEDAPHWTVTPIRSR